MTRTYKFRSTVDADWDKRPKIEGVVKEAAEAIPKLDNRRVLMVETESVIVRVYESYDLIELFDAASVGDSVSIEYLETIQLDGGKTMRRFNAQLWTE